MSNINLIITILMIVVAILIVLLIVLAFIYLSGKKQTTTKNSKKNDNINTKNNLETVKQYSKQSIFNFMEFDKIEDNMIIQKNGRKFLMVVECQGVNYDLMSKVEKVAVEEGFTQFLNTLRHPIQIYTQTRTINLEGSINTYEEKVKEVEKNLERRQTKYRQMQQSGAFTEEQLQKEMFEVTKLKNLYEYGKDIVFTTKRMSLNRNVLRKQYYIVVPYFPDEVGNENFSKEEVQNLAFSELYTRAQSIIRTLSACSITGKIMESDELVELLYVAYNRDEAEVYGLDKALAAGYEEMYSTAPDVLENKMKVLNEKIEEDAYKMANMYVEKAKSPEAIKIEKMEELMDKLVEDRAQEILEENKTVIGEKTAKRAKKIMNEEKQKKGGKKQDGEEKSTRKKSATA